jgi:GNAT superfamily N-acetyltransferase
MDIYYQPADNKGHVRWRVYDGDDCVAYLEVWTQNIDPMIGEIAVRPSHRRRKIATVLLALAKKLYPGLRHSPDRTLMGDAWAKSTGDLLPEPRGALWEAQPHETFDADFDQFYNYNYYIPQANMTLVRRMK